MNTEPNNTITFEDKMQSIRQHYKTSPLTRYAMPYEWQSGVKEYVRPTSDLRGSNFNNSVPLDGLDYKARTIVKGIEEKELYHQEQLETETKHNADQLKAGKITESEFERRMTERRAQAHNSVDQAFDALVDHGLKHPSQQDAILTVTDAIFDFFAKIWAEIAKFFKQVWDWIKNIYYTVTNFFSSVIGSIKGWFGFR